MTPKSICCDCRPKGRSHIMVPCGGANAEGWLAFRDALARIETFTSQTAPAQVSADSPAESPTDSPADSSENSPIAQWLA